ncbi:MAG: hypothetical protein FWH29_07145, partial [Methanobrevibacter sp.]|nr:hypothetical protein [Methanobrevibacter sp.]
FSPNIFGNRYSLRRFNFFPSFSNTNSNHHYFTTSSNINFINNQTKKNSIPKRETKHQMRIIFSNF